MPRIPNRTCSVCEELQRLSREYQPRPVFPRDDRLVRDERTPEQKAMHHAGLPSMGAMTLGSNDPGTGAAALRPRGWYLPGHRLRLHRGPRGAGGLGASGGAARARGDARAAGQGHLPAQRRGRGPARASWVIRYITGPYSSVGRQGYAPVGTAARARFPVAIEEQGYIVGRRRRGPGRNYVPALEPAPSDDATPAHRRYLVQSLPAG